MPKVNYSIVIPHYNIPHLLGRCIKSIPEREDIQVIVVDDCSPNAKEYFRIVPELSRPYVEFYSTPIGGSAGRARNVGIEHAVGKWITFLDADDLFTDQAALLLDRNKDREEDVMYFQALSVMSDDLTKVSDRNIFSHLFNVYFKTGNDQALRLEFDAPWGKFIKKSLIDRYHIRFDEIRYSNDTFFSAAIGVFAQKIFVSEDIIYIVTERCNSLTSDKMRTIEEWDIRYHSALRIQSFFDAHRIRYRRYAFADFLLWIWSRNRNVFLKEYLKLSFRNKRRYIYYNLRHVLSKRRLLNRDTSICR